MSKFNNGKIYEIVCNISGKRYIGSTCELLLCRRLAGHVNIYKRYLNEKDKAKLSSFQVLERGDYYINLLELVNCEDHDVLLSRERHFINTLECVNKNRPIITKEDIKESAKIYYQEHLNSIKEYQKEYAVKNTEKIKGYYLKNAKASICECGGKISYHNRVQHDQTDRHYIYMNEKLFPSIGKDIDLTSGIKIGEVVEDYSHNLLCL